MSNALTIIRQALAIAAAIAALLAAIKGAGIAIPAIRAGITELTYIAVGCAAAVVAQK